MDNQNLEDIEVSIIRIRYTLAILSILLLTASAVRGQASNWIVEGDKVYVDDTNVYISAEPHTLSFGQPVTFTITPKTYSGNVDLAFGFDTDKIRPTYARLYDPHVIEEPMSYTCEGTYDYTIDPNYLWCYEDDKLVFANHFDTGDLQSNTVYWTNYHPKEYRDISRIFTPINFNFRDTSRWWYAKDLPVVAGETYQIEVFFDVELDAGTQKWWFAIKPSNYGIAEAIYHNALYALDPWSNSTWAGYYDINSSMVAGYPFAVNDTFEVGGQDAVWTYHNNTMNLYCQNEGCGTGSFAVGNDTGEVPWERESTQNGYSSTIVWGDSLVGVYHVYDDGDDSSSSNNDATVTLNGSAYNATYNVFGRSLHFLVGTCLDTGFAAPAVTSVEFWAYHDNIAPSQSFGRLMGEDDGTQDIMYIESNGNMHTYLGAGGGKCHLESGAAAWTFGQWNHVVWISDGAGQTLYVNTVKLDGGACADGLGGEILVFGNTGGAGTCLANDGKGFIGNMDEIRIWNINVSEDYINQSYYNGAGGMSSLETWVATGAGADTNFTMWVYDEQDAAGGTYTDVTINLTATNTSQSNVYTDRTNFTSTLDSFENGAVTLTIAATGYYPRTYYRNIDSVAASNLTAYMLATADAASYNVLTINEARQAVDNVTVIIERTIGGTSTIVAEQLTDSAGIAPFYLETGASYTITGVKAGYLNDTITVTASQSPYILTMQQANASEPIDFMTSNVSMFFTPTLRSLNITTVEFNCSVFSHDESLEYMYFDITHGNGTNMYTNTTATTSGDVLSVDQDLFGMNNTNLTATCGFKRVGFEWFNASRTYFIYNETSGLADSGAVSSQGAFGTVELGLVSIVITTMAIGGVISVSRNGTAGALVGLAVLGLLTFWFEWFPWTTYTLLVVTFAAFIFVRRRGGF